MDHFIPTCNLTALLMDSSHCYGNVAMTPSRSPPFVSVESTTPLNYCTSTTIASVGAAPPAFSQGGKGKRRVEEGGDLLKLEKNGVDGRPTHLRLFERFSLYSRLRRAEG